MHAVLRCRTKPSPAQWCTHRSLAQPLGRASRVHALPWRAVSVSVVSEGAADEMAELAAALPSYTQERIRSFCIIAHVDHGKSTLADRLLEETGVIQIEEDEEGRALQTQVMDTLEIGRGCEHIQAAAISPNAVALTHNEMEMISSLSR